MNMQTVIDLMQESFKISLFLALPPLLAGLIVGVIVSIFQSVTSIQEQTLVFVPKMLAVMITLIIAFAWMMSMIIHFTLRLFQDIPQYIR